MLAPTMHALYRASLPLLLIGCASTPDAPHLDVTSQTYVLQPGEEKYLCYTANLPADRDVVITKLTPTYGTGTHHILFSQAVVPEPEGVSECPVLSKQTWVPLYAGGKDSGTLALPENTGFTPFTRGQQVVMQLHLQNASDTPITQRTSMRVDFTDATPDVIPASVFGIDNHVLTIPPHTENAMTEMSCVVDQELNVFAVLGHMHKHGVHLDISRGAVAGAELLYDEAWNFDTQPVTPLSVKIHVNDRVFLRCLHSNTTDMPIPYGESSDTEMCSMIMYYAPANPVHSCTQR